MGPPFHEPPALPGHLNYCVDGGGEFGTFLKWHFFINSRGGSNRSRRGTQSPLTLTTVLESLSAV